MKKIVHKNQSRGYADHGWLKARHTFSFANYYNPDRINFGPLRVLNDDVIAPGMGFGKHPHDNMEIITIPFRGTLAHKDSMGHQQNIEPDEVQVMSAGTGIFHSEFNASKNEEVNLIQVWLFPEKRNIEPRYDQKRFNREQAHGSWQYLVSSENEGALEINQDSKIARTFLTKGDSISYRNRDQAMGNYLFIVEGKVEVASENLDARDGMELTGLNSWTIKALEDSYIINFELVDNN